MEPDPHWQLTGSGPEHYERYTVPMVHAPVAKRLLERVQLHAGQRVLDVACGTGLVVRLVAPLVGPAGHLTGVDLNEGMLAVARACAAAAGLAIEWRQGDAASLPFGDETYDVALCQQGLQFFPDKVRSLREIRRVLVPGGTLALSVSVADAFNVALAEGLSRYADTGAAACSLSPFALGDKTLLKGILEDAGFSGAEIQTVTFHRPVEPTQQWLLERSAGTPYGLAIASLAASERAVMMREIAARLREFWNGDCFSVPRQVHLAYARKS